MGIPNRQFKSAIYEQFARIGKAVASPQRLEILDLLGQAECGVEALAAKTGLTVANASQHLQVLRGARLVEAEKTGVSVRYRLADMAVADFLRGLRILAEKRLAEVEHITRSFLAGRGPFEPVDRDELIRRVLAGEATVLDVRPSEEYRAGHIAQAVSIPLKEIEQHLAELPRDRLVVAYCRGPYCVLAVEAVELLRTKGFQAVRLEDSVHDWAAQGHPVTVSETPRTLGTGLGVSHEAD